MKIRKQKGKMLNMSNIHKKLLPNQIPKMIQTTKKMIEINIRKNLQAQENKDENPLVI